MTNRETDDLIRRSDMWSMINAKPDISDDERAQWVARLNAIPSVEGRPDLSHVGLIQFEVHYGKLKDKKVAVFNRNKLTDSVAEAMVRNGEAENSADMIICEEKAWVNVFRNGRKL